MAEMNTPPPAQGAAPLPGERVLAELRAAALEHEKHPMNELSDRLRAFVLDPENYELKPGTGQLACVVRKPYPRADGVSLFGRCQSKFFSFVFRLDRREHRAYMWALAWLVDSLKSSGFRATYRASYKDPHVETSAGIFLWVCVIPPDGDAGELPSEAAELVRRVRAVEPLQSLAMAWPKTAGARRRAAVAQLFPFVVRCAHRAGSWCTYKSGHMGYANLDQTLVANHELQLTIPPFPRDSAMNVIAYAGGGKKLTKVDFLPQAQQLADDGFSVALYDRATLKQRKYKTFRERVTIERGPVLLRVSLRGPAPKRDAGASRAPAAKRVKGGAN